MGEKARRFRWLVAGLLYSLADHVGPPVPDDDERDARIRASVMDRVAADYGTGQATKQLAAVIMADDMATGKRVEGHSNGHDRGQDR